MSNSDIVNCHIYNKKTDHGTQTCTLNQMFVYRLYNSSKVIHSMRH